MAPVRLSALEPLLWAAGAVVLAVVPFALSTFQVVQITVFLIFCLLATIGITCTTVCPSMRRREATRAPVTRPGRIGGG